MMQEIKVPNLGESESEAVLEHWLKQPGDAVAIDDVIAEIESDKVTMEITAFEAGVLSAVYKQAGETVTPGEVIGVLDTTQAVAAMPTVAASETSVVSAPPPIEPKPEVKVANVTPPAATITAPASTPTSATIAAGEREQRRVPMTAMRRRIAARLKQAQNNAAILTTFNEVNMQPVMNLRRLQQDAFTHEHGVKLGFMSFFVRACAYAAQQVPAINAFIDGDDIVYHNYMDVGVAVATEHGLMVPVLRDAGVMGFADIERGIANLAERARNQQLKPADLSGGTFTITNGGVFGSLLSTPLLNPPQSAILGMHTIQKRVVVEDDQMVIRPMMYVALSYDHRLIDGREAVQFLVAVKNFIEQPGLGLLEIA
jgi:2-oxoglutarate dehydrogenase E2 component (dihydrolipoamide succinyltransferase)